MSSQLAPTPVLTTDRLTLRGPALGDLDTFVEFYTSDRSAYVGGPLTKDAAWRLFATEIGHWHLRGFGMWTVTLNGDDTALGMVGCWYPDGWPEREVGWLLWPDAEGKGFAFEAAQAALTHAFGTLGWHTAVSYIDAPNTRSVALAERLGATLDKAARTPEFDDGAEVLVYRHLSPEAA